MDYNVNYNINVNAETATTSIRNFTAAVNRMGGAFGNKKSSLADFQKMMSALNKNMEKLKSFGKITVDIQTSKATTNVKKLNVELEKAVALMKQIGVPSAAFGGGGRTRSVSTRSGSSTGTSHAGIAPYKSGAKQARGNGTPYTSMPYDSSAFLSRGWTVTNIPTPGRNLRILKGNTDPFDWETRYDMFGRQQRYWKYDNARPFYSDSMGSIARVGGYTKQAPRVPAQPEAALPPVLQKHPLQKNYAQRAFGGRNQALEMAKGMGIAYGVAGLGGLISNTLAQATEYDNLMQSTKNILATHDKKADFEGRFYDMERTIRQVGIETKYTAPQVADASKFLAMAGYDITGIKHAISPIADIALVGDTDLAETADVVTNIMTSYNIAPERLRNAADVMTMTFTKSNTTLLEMAEAYKYAGGLLSAGNIAFEESAAALGILGDAGIKGSLAGTAIRAIMANLVGPTANQAKKWKELGIERFKEDGNLRDLADIFNDLKNKNLQLSDYKSLFRLTAVPAAVALTEHVDKWNEIIELNFLSDGTVKRLADEKKNTVQGLWYQMTSAFTEQGMVVFEGVQGDLKQMMKDMTAWLNSGEAVQAIKNISDIILMVVKQLKDWLIVATDWFNKFGFIIKPFVKLKLDLLPFTMAIRLLTSMRTTMLGLIGVSQRAGTALTSFFAGGGGGKAGGAMAMGGGLFGMFSGNAKAADYMAYYAKHGAAYNYKYDSVGKLSPGAIKLSEQYGFGHLKGGVLKDGTAVSRWFPAYSMGTEGIIEAARAKELAKYQQRMLELETKYAGKGVVGQTKKAFGARKALSSYNKGVNSITKTALGMGGFTSAMMGVSAWMPMIGLAGLAVWGVYDAVSSVREEATRAFDAWREFSDKSFVNQTYMSETLSPIERHLLFLSSTQDDINKRTEEYRNLWLSINDDAKKEEERKQISEQLQKQKDSYDMRNGFWSGFWNFNRIGKEERAIEKEWWERIAGAGYSLAFERYHDGTKGNEHNEIFLKLAELETYGGKLPIVESLYKTYSLAFLNAGNNPILQAKEKANYKAALDDLKNKVDPQYDYIKNIDEAYKILKDGDVDPLQIRAINAGVRGAIDNKVNLPNHEKIWAGIASVADGAYIKDPQSVYKPEHLFPYLKVLNQITDFNGFIGGEEAVNGVKSTLDILKLFVEIDEKGDVKNVSSDVVKRVGDFVTMINAVYTAMGDSQQKQFPYLAPGSELMDILGAISQGKSPNVTDLKNNFLLGVSALPNNQMTSEQWKKWAASENAQQDISNAEKTTTSMPKTPKFKQNDYASNYRSQAAAPKQVIVKIENLMNVKSIDLSNPDNQAVIDNVKEQLAQALVDVVHDFDATFHG